jgi:thiol-disulfide isomerase/thioredoxin
MLIAVAALVLLSHVQPTAAPLPEEPFSELGFDAALAKAKSEKKLLVVDFTASWCPPCKRMDKDTWPAADVRAWLAANAIALQIDVDANPELGKRYQVQSLPTIVALRDGEEADRFIGYRDPARFLAWAKDVAAGKKESDGLLERSKTLRESEDVRARHQLAKDLQTAKQYDEALVHYLWLWPATRAESGYGGVRTSFMLSDMADLAKTHEPAKKAFEQIFAELQARVDAPGVPTFEDWIEWRSFCRYFGAPQRLVAWYEVRRDDAGRLLADQAGYPAELIVEDAFDALVQAGRFEEAARLYDDAQPRAERCVERYEQLMAATTSFPQDDTRASAEDHARRTLTQQLGTLYAVMLYAERGDEAAAVAGSLLAALDTPESRMALVREGIKVAKLDPSYAVWLDEAEAAGAKVDSLRRKVSKLAPEGG